MAKKLAGKCSRVCAASGAPLVLALAVKTVSEATAAKRCFLAGDKS